MTMRARPARRAKRHDRPEAYARAWTARETARGSSREASTAAQENGARRRRSPYRTGRGDEAIGSRIETGAYNGAMDAVADASADATAAAARARSWWRLGATSPRLTQHGAWLQACVETLGCRSALSFVTVGDEGAERALAPLVRTGRLGRVGLLGVEAFNEPTDFLAEDEAALAAVCDRLAARGMPLALARLPADSPTVAALRRAYRGRGAMIVRPYQGSPIIRLDDTWREAASHLNARRRADLRRAQRRAEAEGPVAVEIHEPGPDTLAPILQEALEVELRSWKGKVGAAILQDEARGPTLRRFAELAAEAGIMRLALLRIGETAVAMQFACVHGDAFWLLKVAYDETFKRCSPGQLLAEATIGHAAAAGLARYEFLGSPEAWTALWANDEQACVLLRTFPYRPRGMALFAGDALRAVGHRVKEVFQRGDPEPAA